MTNAESSKPPIKLETITLKVYIHCEGCRRKVRRIIRILDGVEDVAVDSASGKVTVTGTGLDVKTILQRLQKYGKHAEVWPSSNPAAPPTAAKAAGANQPKPIDNSGPDSGNKKKKNNGGGTDGGSKSAAADASKKGDGKEAATPGGAAAKGKQETAANETKPDKSKQAATSEVANNAKESTENGDAGGGGGGAGGGKKGGKKGGGNGSNVNGTDNSGGVLGGNVEAPSIGPPPPYIDIPVLGAPPSATSVVVSVNRSIAPYDSVQTGYSYHSADYATHMFSDENANSCSIM